MWVDTQEKVRNWWELKIQVSSMLLWGKHLQKIVARQAYNACTSLYYKNYLDVKWVGLGLTRPPPRLRPCCRCPVARVKERKKKRAATAVWTARQRDEKRGREFATIRAGEIKHASNHFSQAHMHQCAGCLKVESL